MKPDLNKPRILLVCARPKDALKDSPLPEHQQWFEHAMDLEDGSIETIYASDQNYPTVDDYDAVIVGGSKYSVNDDVPWIPVLEEFVRSVINARKKFLGVCFGHQVAVKALGGTIERGKNGPEVGSVKVQLTEAGMSDDLFSGMPEQFSVAQFHRDIVTGLPKRSDVSVIAKNTKYDIQGLAVGDFARTVQFHPEFTADIISYVMERYKDELIGDGLFSNEGEMNIIKTKMTNSDFEKNGSQIARHFLEHFILA